MRNSEVWKRILGWQVGDYLKYCYLPSFSSKGTWLTLRIIEIENGGFVKVKVLDKSFGMENFHLRIEYVEQHLPERIQTYTPRKSTVKKLEEECKMV